MRVDDCGLHEAKNIKVEQFSDVYVHHKYIKKHMFASESIKSKNEMIRREITVFKSSSSASSTSLSICEGDEKIQGGVPIAQEGRALLTLIVEPRMWPVGEVLAGRRRDG